MNDIQEPSPPFSTSGIPPFRPLQNVTPRIGKPVPYDLTRPEGGFEVRRILQGYVIPPLTIMVVCINIFMLIVFFKGRFRTSTHVILVAIAIADMVVGVSVAIPATYYFTFGNYQEHIAINWCAPYITLSSVIPTIVHCMSLTFTVALAVQRLIVIKLPFKAKTICSRRNTFIVILVVMCYAIITHVSYFYKFQQIEGRYFRSKVDPTKRVYACIRYKSPIPTETKTLVRIAFSKVIPISALVLTSLILIYEVYKISRQLKEMTNSIKQINILHRLQQNRKITLMTSLVVMSVVVAEVPAMIISLVITYGDPGLFSCQVCAKQTFFLIFHIVILVLYPSNFLICCFVSKDVRSRVKRMLTCRPSSYKQNSPLSSIISLSTSSKL